VTLSNILGRQVHSFLPHFILLCRGATFFGYKIEVFKGSNRTKQFEKVNNCWNIKNFFYSEKSGAGNTKGGSITVPLTSCLTGLD
jgi:hypothetical protein